MEAGKTKAGKEKVSKLDLVDAMVQAADDNVSDEDVAQVENAMPANLWVSAPGCLPLYSNELV